MLGRRALEASNTWPFADLLLVSNWVIFTPGSLWPFPCSGILCSPCLWLLFPSQVYTASTRNESTPLGCWPVRISKASNPGRNGRKGFTPKRAYKELCKEDSYTVGCFCFFQEWQIGASPMGPKTIARVVVVPQNESSVRPLHLNRKIMFSHHQT